MPGKGRVADPGLVVVTPGSGVMRIIPVSVCHQVSTIGHRPPPIVLRYHRQASGLIGSPTVPRRRRLDRSCRFGYSSPHRMNARIAVGAVYRIVMSYSSIIRQNRSGSGQSGAPSYMKTLAPFARGPYTMYEWPVTHPMSAVHQNRSSSFRSKTYFVVVATPTRYPPVECWIPFGFPVVPDVYRMNNGSVASIASGSHSASALAMSSCHQWSRRSPRILFSVSASRSTYRHRSW